MKISSGLLLVALVLSLSACDAASDAASDASGSVGDFTTGAAAKDQIEVYDIAKKNGDKMQTCAQAMVIAQLFLQAKDEARWKEWKAREAVDCKAAGMTS